MLVEAVPKASNFYNILTHCLIDVAQDCDEKAEEDVIARAKKYSEKLLLQVSDIIEPVKFLNLSDYVKIVQIGQGAYGDVWLAENLKTNEIVALKKLKLNEEREGVCSCIFHSFQFPKSSIREISLLRYLDHVNIVKLLGIAHSKPSNIQIDSPDESENFIPVEDTKYQKFKGYVWVVFEYLPFDLTGVIDQLKEQDKMLTISEIKIIFTGIVKALDYCHSRNVIHRDLKSVNLLITHDGVLKVADFGLSRLYNSELSTMTNRVVTLWYRPPELLLGSNNYTQSVDIWSAGCILAELILNKAIFTADKEYAVLKAISACLGLPNDENWPDRVNLPLWNVLHANPFLVTDQTQNSASENYFDKPTRNISRSSTLFWNSLLERVGKCGVELLRKMLCYNPNNRLTARQILIHPWISEVSSNSKINLSRFNRSHCHAFVIRKDREKNRTGANARQAVPANTDIRKHCPRILNSITYFQKLRLANVKKTEALPAKPLSQIPETQTNKQISPKRQRVSTAYQKSTSNISDDGGMDLEEDDLVENKKPVTPQPPQSPIPLPPQTPPPPLPTITPPNLIQPTNNVPSAPAALAVIISSDKPEKSKLSPDETRLPTKIGSKNKQGFDSVHEKSETLKPSHEKPTNICYDTSVSSFESRAQNRSNNSGSRIHRYISSRSRERFQNFPGDNSRENFYHHSKKNPPHYYSRNDYHKSASYKPYHENSNPSYMSYSPPYMKRSRQSPHSNHRSSHYSPFSANVQSGRSYAYIHAMNRRSRSSSRSGHLSPRMRKNVRTWNNASVFKRNSDYSPTRSPLKNTDQKNYLNRDVRYRYYKTSPKPYFKPYHEDSPSQPVLKPVYYNSTIRKRRKYSNSPPSHQKKLHNNHFSPDMSSGLPSYGKPNYSPHSYHRYSSSPNRSRKG